MITTMLSAKRWKKIILLLGYDSGIGIDPKIMPRLFTKFATKSFQGLGLFISKNIVEDHGEKIWAQNKKDGRESTFYFSHR